MSLVELWLPIVLSAVAVFIVAAVAHTVLPHHKGDWGKAPAEDDLLETLRSKGIGPGQYMFPFCTGPGELKDEAAKKRFEAGPHGTLTVWPGVPNMTRNLILSFIFYLVVSIFVAYLGALAIDAGSFREVFRVTGTAGIMAYVLGGIPQAIWFGCSGRSLLMYIIDGIVYGLITGLIFGWLWPEVVEAALPVVG
ncbi:MAG: hypothetical protein JSV91_01320 [Phycisphaerales bacterium]|nr:MAG: hypothetical protein JSV91_01320 [Phycisphaerales bacterium]